MRRREEGAASVFAVSLIAVLLLIGMAAVFVTATAAAHRRAQSSADLASLAGAVALQEGGDPCIAAAGIAGENRAALLGCRVQGEDVVVTVEVPGPEFLGHAFQIRGRARAGPG